ncbi:MAG TPA: hypothetical protein VMX55_14845 [candidate division Zixibacteria bacterium]|nr:hypothetical protein [candidate division Zixibacteria bacterium]
MSINNSLVYIIDDYYGPDIFNVSDIHNPEQIGSTYEEWTLTSTCSNMIVRNDYIFYINHWDEENIYVLDQADFSDIAEITHYCMNYSLGNFLIKDWDMFVTSGKNFFIYEFDNFSPLNLVGNYTCENATFTDLAIKGNFSYILDSSNGLTTLNITNYSDIQLVSELILNDTSFFSDFYVTENYIYIYENEIGLHVINITDPFSPESIIKYNFTDRECEDIFADNNYIYLLNYWEMEILDISNLPTIEQIGRYIPGYNHNFEALTIKDNFAYIYSTQTGEFEGRRPLYIANITNPAAPIHIFPGKSNPFGFPDWLNKLLISLGIIALVAPTLIATVILIAYYSRKRVIDKRIMNGQPSKKINKIE